MIRFALLLALVPLSATADVPPLRIDIPVPPPKVCIGDTTCPAPAAISKCQGDALVVDVRGAPDRFLDKSVSIVGSLEKDGPIATCTKWGCSAKDRCCNSCDHQVVIAPTSFNANYARRRNARRFRPQPPSPGRPGACARRLLDAP